MNDFAEQTKLIVDRLYKSQQIEDELIAMYPESERENLLAALKTLRERLWQ